MTSVKYSGHLYCEHFLTHKLERNVSHQIRSGPFSLFLNYIIMQEFKKNSNAEMYLTNPQITDMHFLVSRIH